MSARTAATGGDATATWLAGWTVFYWAWWISWTPFVGMFIARISRGRTIRQFVAGVILIPSAVSLLWFAIFGGAAIDLQRNGIDLASRPTEGQLFGLLDTLPLGAVLGVIAMLLVAIFFVSGADAASIVMGTLSQRGTIHPPRGVVVFWGAVMGAIAAIMLIVGGGEGDALSGIQNITIIMAAPFVVVMVLMCVALTRDLRGDPLVRRGLRSQQGDRAGGRVRQRELRRRLLRAGQAAPDRAPPQRGVPRGARPARGPRRRSAARGRRRGHGGRRGERHTARRRRPGAAHGDLHAVGRPFRPRRRSSRARSPPVLPAAAGSAPSGGVILVRLVFSSRRS